MINLENVKRFCGDICVLNDISLSINECGIYGILGPKKCGKTTLLKTLNASVFPDTGIVKVDDLDTCKHDDELKKCVFFLQRESDFFPEMKIGEYLVFVAKTFGIAKENIKEKIQTALKKTNLANDSDLLIINSNQLCRKRIGIACAILCGYKYILLDEPSKYLNSDETIKIHKLIREISLNRTVIIDTSSLTEARDLCDRVFIMKNGKIMYDDQIENIMNNIASSDILLCKIKGSKEKLSTALKGYKYKILQNNTTRGILSVSIECSDIKMEKVSNALVRNGCAILEMKPESASLEALLAEISEVENEDKNEDESIEFVKISSDDFELDDKDGEDNDENKEDDSEEKDDD